MIASVRGTLIAREVAGVIVEAAGVGHFIEVPLGTYERLPALGEQVMLHTELVVREDAWLLFGFDRASDRLVFRRLLGASGVGARIALAILSSLGADRTVRAIREKDLAVLASVPGIGRKKAERLALELGDRLDDIPVTSGAPVPSSPAAAATQALLALGYAASAAEAAVRRLAELSPDADTAQLVRRALSELTRS
ncbi:MAG: Holliday junction branch migration protein RuvA [Gemmatimonadota bacterium]